MSDNSGSRSGLERWLALLVRYWAFNMNLIHDQGTNWPGFGYTPDEKSQLQSIGRPVPGIEYLVWIAVTVVLFLLILAVVVILGMNTLPPQASAALQITRVALVAVVLLTALWIVVPGDSKLWTIGQRVLPLLSPAVAALTTAYYFSTRLKRARSAPSDSER